MATGFVIKVMSGFGKGEVPEQGDRERDPVFVFRAVTM